jgi:hypothetical protein
MDKIKLFFKSNQQAIVLLIGYLLVAALGFGFGRFTDNHQQTREIRVEEAFTSPTNYSPNVSGAQTATEASTNVKSAVNCDGKIKGSSSGIYHIPGGAFYTKTTKPVRCFNTEAEAVSAGFRKSSN